MVDVKNHLGNERGAILLLVLVAAAFIIPLVYAGLDQRLFQISQVDNNLQWQTAWRNSQSMLSQTSMILAYDGATTQSDNLLEMWTQPIPLRGLSGAMTTEVIEDGQRYWNINSLLDGAGKLDSQRYKIYKGILLSLDIPVGLLDSLRDWLDKDDIPHGPNGAEDEFYRREKIYYGAWNAPLANLAELRLVRGWRPEYIERLRPYFRAWPPGVNDNLNINTASRRVLSSLSPELSAAGIDAVISRRAEKPFTRLSELTALPELKGIYLPINLLGVSSNIFYILCTSRQNHMVGRMRALIFRDRGKVTIKWLRWEP